MILCFKTTTIQNNISVDWFLFEEIKNNYESYKACLLANENAKLNNVFRDVNCEFQLKRLRYRFLDLHSNLTSIFCLIIKIDLLFLTQIVQFARKLLFDFLTSNCPIRQKTLFRFS